MTEPHHSPAPAPSEPPTVDDVLATSVTPEPAIAPSVVSRALSLGAVVQDTRLEMGIDPVTNEPALRLVSTVAEEALDRSVHLPLR